MQPTPADLAQIDRAFGAGRFLPRMNLAKPARIPARPLAPSKFAPRHRDDDQ